MTGTPDRTERLHQKLLAWYGRARRDLPWRHTRDPYAVWLSEVMLQQTRVETVVPYYERFLSTYPTVHALAEAPLDQVLRLWAGLGYYRRARMLHAGARDVDRDRMGSLPRTAAELVKIKGIGRYTAGAVASIAWGEAVPVVDGNVERVLSRLFALDADKGEGKGASMWELAASLVAASDPSSWNQALMELGALVCVPRHPRCGSCPIEAECEARARGLEQELPRIRVKKAPELVRRVGFVIRSRGHVWLGRRLESGLFGGMWEPPHADEAVVRSRGRKLVIESKGRVQEVGRITHVLSHRRIEMTIFAGQASQKAVLPLGRQLSDYDALAWVDQGELGTRALTSLAWKVLARGGISQGIVAK
jgi:A/G-specific adenine glycosylase